MSPLWIKIAHTAFVLALVPPYLRHYGPANCLWFSDIALLAMVPALWLESPLIASIMAVGVLPLELAWNVDFFGRLHVRRAPAALAARALAVSRGVACSRRRSRPRKRSTR